MICKFLKLSPLALLPVFAQAQPAGWVDPFPPHKVMDNVYYVGTAELASFLITTPEGHILVNSNYEAGVPVIQAGVEALGFDFSDIRILISGHAHPDHVEGDALVKELTGAEVVVGRDELEYVVTYKHPFGRKQPVDIVIEDGETVSLGGTTLTAHLHPGHTRGCLSWSMDLEENGRTYYALIECSLNGRFLQYVGNTEYPEIAEDMRTTYAKARALPVEVPLSSHGQFYGMHAKYDALQNMQPGDANPFIDPEGWKQHVDEFEAGFEEALARQLAEAAAE